MNEIIQIYMNCKSCMDQLPKGQSMREFARINVGWTKKGFQVWCIRCDKNIIAIDVLGQKILPQTEGD